MRRSIVPVTVVLLAGCAQPKPGVLIMAHGGDPEWNRQVEAVVQPLCRQYPTEIAFGMATPSTIEAAVEKLEARGVQKVAVVRMFISGDSFLGDTERILGLRDESPPEVRVAQAALADPPCEHAHAAHHDQIAMVKSPGTNGSDGTDGTDAAAEHGSHDHHRMEPPRRIRSSVQFVLSRQGVAESGLIDQILVDRVRALSRDPEKESILILGHGPGDDDENERWLVMMRQRSERLGEIGRFRSVRCETLREDWPETRAAAEKRIRQYVTDGNQDSGRVIVVPFRLAGFGPYKEVLAGLDYVADGRGFCPHPNMTRWLQETIRKTLSAP